MLIDYVRRTKSLIFQQWVGSDTRGSRQGCLYVRGRQGGLHVGGRLSSLIVKHL